MKQTQKVEGLVGLFDVPVDVEITTASGRKTLSDRGQPGEPEFHFPRGRRALMVLFDKGDKILKTVDFDKDPADADLSVEKCGDSSRPRGCCCRLGQSRNNPDVVAALGEPRSTIPSGEFASKPSRARQNRRPAAQKKSILAAANDEKPWVRDVGGRPVREISEDSVARRRSSRTSPPTIRRIGCARPRCESLGKIKAPNAYDTLAAAVKTDSPNDILRDAACAAWATSATPRRADPARVVRHRKTDSQPPGGDQRHGRAR